MEVAKLRVVGAVGAALLLLLFHQPVQAAGRTLRVYVAPDACPSAALLQQQLTPLLERDAVLQFEHAESTGSGKISVRDLGESYAIDIGGLYREVDDPGRDCLERARVAAVFIALNAKKTQPAPSPAPPAEPEPEPEEVEAPEEPPDPDRLQLGLALFGAASYATALERAAPGGGASVWVGRHAFRVGLTAALLAPAELELGPNDTGLGAAVELMRLPFTLSASYLLEAGPLRLGPALGLAVDLLRMRGLEVIDPQTELRVNPGVLVGADAYLYFSPELVAVLRLSFSAFARAYDLSVDPAGKLGSTPQLWLGAHLGVGWQIL